MEKFNLPTSIVTQSGSKAIEKPSSPASEKRVFIKVQISEAASALKTTAPPETLTFYADQLQDLSKESFLYGLMDAVRYHEISHTLPMPGTIRRYAEQFEKPTVERHEYLNWAHSLTPEEKKEGFENARSFFKDALAILSSKKETA